MPREVKESEESVAFKAEMTGPSAVFKVSDDGGDRFIIWGKASVEVVDKENDLITADALKDALPQLLRRKRLSLEHTDQLVGDIIDEFETDGETTVEIDGKTYERSVFPTDVLKLDEDEPPALFVAGEVWNDTRQAKEVREDIENGVIDSYSISGEAIKTSTKVEDGEAFDKITELDLSAVTLCEEGMNHKAKFGTVVKRIGGDDSVSPVALGKTSSGNAVTAKQDMSDEDTSDGDPDGLDKSELQEEFQKAAQEAIEEADFATKDDVEDIVDQRLEREDESDDEPTNASDEAGDDMEEQKSEEEADEKADSDVDADEKDAEEAEEKGDDSDEEMPEEMPDETKDDEKAVSEEDAIEAAQTIEAFLEAADDEEDDEEDAEMVDPDEVEDPDDDGEEEVDLDPDEDEEMPMEGDDDEEEKGDLVSQLEAEGVPDDLCEAVSEHLDGGDDEMEEEEEMVEMEDEGDMDEAAKEKSNTPISDADLDSDLGDASTDGEYLDMTASAAVPETDEDEDLRKSFEHTDKDVDSTPGTLDALYESMGEEI